MREVLSGLGFHVEEHAREGVVHASFPIRATDEARAASDRRAWTASAESVQAVLHPGSIALIGASNRAGTIGHALVANLVRDGFRGPIYPVNPNAEVIAGLRAYPNIAAIGRSFDLGLVAVPAPAVEEVVAECARAGARGVVVISAGFAEASAEGRAAQVRLRELVRGSGMRMVGPNCMGVLNTDPAVSLNGTFAPAFPPAGNVGMLSQSGALGLAILDYARELDIGISTFVSVGNKADVSGNDLLAYWKDDPRTDVIALYLESFGNPRRFARLAPEVARRKPIVAVKSGRSAAGTRAASSHSAALACLDVAVDALFEQAGVIRTDTLEDLFDVVSLSGHAARPSRPARGRRHQRGRPRHPSRGRLRGARADAAELTPETVTALRSFLPAAAGLKNPVDMIASATARALRPDDRGGGRRSRRGLRGDHLRAAAGDERGRDRLGRGAGAGTVPEDKPVLSVFLSSKGAPPALATGARGRLPSYSFPENAARALAAAERYGRWRARPAGTRAAPRT